MRRVVVTGLGAISPLGVGIRRTWTRLLASESGIVSSSNLEPSAQWRELPSKVAGIVPVGSRGEGKWQASDWLDKGEERRLAKFTQYAIAATEMAFADAGWKPQTQEEKEMTGVCLGSGIGNLEELYNTSIAYNQAVSYDSIGNVTSIATSTESVLGLQESVAALCATASNQPRRRSYFHEVRPARTQSCCYYGLYDGCTCYWRRVPLHRFRRR